MPEIMQHAPEHGRHAEASEISAQPKNGTLRMEGMANAIYTPKAGFTGDDEFAFTIKGRNQQVSGTSVLVIREREVGVGRHVLSPDQRTLVN